MGDVIHIGRWLMSGGGLLGGRPSGRGKHGVQTRERREPRIRDVPIHELGNPRVANARLVGDALPLTTARLQSVSDNDIKGGVHCASVAKLCDLNKQHFATPFLDTLRMAKKTANQVLAEALRFFMGQGGWNYTTLAAVAGVSANTIKNYCTPEGRELGASGKERSAKLAEVEQLADALDLHLTDLLIDATDDERARLLRKRAAEYYEVNGRLPNWAPGRVIGEGAQEEPAGNVAVVGQRKKAST
jgi:hypothetical protein